MRSVASKFKSLMALTREGCVVINTERGEELLEENVVVQIRSTNDQGSRVVRLCVDPQEANPITLNFFTQFPYFTVDFAVHQVFIKGVNRGLASG